MSRIHYKSFSKVKEYSRDLRKNMTPQEKILWEILRKKKFYGYRFLRQHPVFYSIDKGWTDFFIPDFYCNKLKMIIELDGKIHEKQKEYDLERDSKLKAKGLIVIRIANEKTEDPEELVIFISKVISERIEYLFH